MKLHYEIPFFQLILINPKVVQLGLQQCIWSAVNDIWLSFHIRRFRTEKVPPPSCRGRVLKSGSWIRSGSFRCNPPYAIKNLPFITHFRKLDEQHKALTSFSTDPSYQGVRVVNTKAARCDTAWGAASTVHTHCREVFSYVPCFLPINTKQFQLFSHRFENVKAYYYKFSSYCFGFFMTEYFKGN